MPANSRWDLIRRLKVKITLSPQWPHLSLQFAVFSYRACKQAQCNQQVNLKYCYHHADCTCVLQFLLSLMDCEHQCPLLLMFSLHIQLVSMWRASEGVETEMCFCLLYAFFCVIPQRLNFVCRHFGTLCLFHLHRRVGTKNSSHLPAYEDGTDSVFRNVGI